MRKRIQKSMILTLLVTLIPFYIIMSLALYYKNMSLLEKEVRQEGKYISGAINMAGTHYLEQLEQLDQIDTGTRLTLIEEDGTVLYDSKVSGATMDNHSSRKEVEEAFSSGEGEVVRMSSTVQKELYYYALRLDDGSVLRVSKTMDSLIWTALNVFPVMLILSVAGIVLAVVLARWQTKKLMDPVIHLDLEHPLENVIYEEMTPFLEAMDVQNKEKEAVSNMRKEFSANVSHELKTPLTSISGYAEIMMNGLVRPEDIQGFSERIYKEARRLITLVEDIIKLSKLDDESVELEKEDVDLYNLTREIVSRLSPQSTQKKIHVSVSGEPVIFNGIKQILDEMIYNITENAIKYNNDGGYVDVWVGNTLNGPKVSVEDNGIGIPKEHQERIFERFYRVDKSHSKERGGTGLGLSIVKHGAIIHGAKVNVDSAPGRGTKIEIQFPLEPKKKEAETGTKE
nr:ATP-binding protein [uncultured Mediterraneibacter sp.]